LKDMFEVTRRHMPPTDVVRLLDMVVVNVLVCNTDAHAKNYSIMIRGNGASLAPLYDVMCGKVWESVTKNLAQKIAGKSRGDYLTGRDWQLFARECGLNPKQVIDRVGTLAKSVISEAEAAQSEVAAMPAGGHEILDQARHAVERRARTCSRSCKSQEAIQSPDPLGAPRKLRRRRLSFLQLRECRSWTAQSMSGSRARDGGQASWCGERQSRDDAAGRTVAFRPMVVGARGASHTLPDPHFGKRFRSNEPYFST
jgi:HipA-like C-terminal domain